MLPLVEKTVPLVGTPLVPMLEVVYPTQMELNVPTVLVPTLVPALVRTREY